MSIISHHMLMSAIRGDSPTPPTYEYSILQNFVEGHSIGQPDTTKGDNWITQVLTEEELYDDLWCGEFYYNLVDNTVGAKLIDDRKPLDFSKYGITSGTPYGMSSCNTDSDYCHLSFNLEHNIYPITVETFAFSRSSQIVAPLFMIGNPRINEWTGYNITLNPNVENEGGFSLNIQGGWYPYDIQTLVEFSIDGFDSSSWHHYAVTIDTNNVYVFIDGILKSTVPLSTECSFDVMVQGTWQVEHRSGTLKQMLDAMGSVIWIKASSVDNWALDYGFAQFAVCNQCKWTYDFEVPTEAY